MLVLEETNTHLDEVVREGVQSACRRVLEQVDDMKANILRHIQSKCDRQRPEMKRQDRRLVEISYAMKTLRYSISALQDECQQAVAAAPPRFAQRRKSAVLGTREAASQTSDE